MKNIDWALIQKEYDAGKSQADLVREYKISYADISIARNNGQFKSLSHKDAMARSSKIKPRRKLNNDERKALSERMKKLFVERPELHPNRKVANNRSKMSYPERLGYDYLQRNNIDFIHNAKIGPYFVDFLIGTTAIEIDGEYWHKDKVYDERRDAYIAGSGVNIIRIKASDIIKDSDNILLQEAIKGRISSKFLEEFRDKHRQALNEINLCSCGNKKFKNSIHCKQCADKQKIKFNDKEALILKLIELDYNYRAVGRFYGVSDNMIRKYCRRLGISIVKRRFRHMPGCSAVGSVPVLGTGGRGIIPHHPDLDVDHVGI